MANRMEWAQRVAEWRASGLKAPEFCIGRGYSAAMLREWSCRLRKAERGDQLQVVRVERAVEVSCASREVAEAGVLTIELGGARVSVPRGCDPAMLRMALEVLAGVAGGAR